MKNYWLNRKKVDFKQIVDCLQNRLGTDYIVHDHNESVCIVHLRGWLRGLCLRWQTSGRLEKGTFFITKSTWQYAELCYLDFSLSNVDAVIQYADKL
jgi:hypothetical protein